MYGSSTSSCAVSDPSFFYTDTCDLDLAIKRIWLSRVLHSVPCARHYGMTNLAFRSKRPAMRRLTTIPLPSGGEVHDTTGLSSAPPRQVVSLAETSGEGCGPKRSSRMPRCLSSELMRSSVTDPSGDASDACSISHAVPKSRLMSRPGRHAASLAMLRPERKLASGRRPPECVLGTYAVTAGHPFGDAIILEISVDV